MTVLNGEIDKIVLPVEKVDIIISQWMGYFLLYNSYARDIIYARDKWLDPDGFIFPDKAVINLAAFSDEETYEDKFNKWNEIEGVDMSLIKYYSLREVYFDSLEKCNNVSTICKIFEIDLYTVKIEELNFSSSYELMLTNDKKLTGIVAWFDVYFNSKGRLYESVCFTTGPFNESTQYRQTLFYIDDSILNLNLFPYKLKSRDILKGSIACKKADYTLDVKISFHILHDDDGSNVNYNFYQLYKIKIC